jgi:hypothetical protein
MSARSELALRLEEAYALSTGTPNTGADGKDVRAVSVHAPFSDISVSRAPFRLEGRSGLQPAKIALTPKRHVHDCHL